MGDDPKPPAAEESWTAIALRDPDGYFVARGITWQVVRIPSPLFAETWETPQALEVWLADRLLSFRRQVRSGDFQPVRLVVRVADVPQRIEEHAETRPLVAEAAGFQ